MQKPPRTTVFPAESTALASVPSGVHFTTLPNGLTVIIKEDASAPVLAAQAWCQTGSVNEGKWLGSGLSHVLEHMLFKGTATRGLGRIDQEVQDVGGQMNAFTSFDRTVYWINAPRAGARQVVDILCDIMRNATLPEMELVKEMDVIRREMDMNEDAPARRSARKLFEAAYTTSPYRFSIIGCPDIFNRLTRREVVSYYEERYAPNNLLFVVVGDVDASAVTRQIRDAFKNAPARPIPALALASEPPQIAPREVIEEGPFELAHLHFSWHIPPIHHPAVPALDVLATLLGHGRSSRLHQRLRERAGLVHSIDAWTYSLGHPGLIGISAVADGDRFREIQAALDREIQTAKKNGFTALELSKAVKQTVAATLAARKTMQGQAQDLGASWMEVHDLGFPERYLQVIRRLTPEDIQRVAQEYLAPENRTISALLPRGSVTPEPRNAISHTRSPIRAIELRNGLRLLLKADHRLPFVEWRAVFRAGVLSESRANNGVSHLTARTLLKGAGTRNASRLVEDIESVGGHLESYSANNSFGLRMEVLREDTELGLDILTDLILHPTFPEVEIERERTVQLAAIRSEKDHLLQRALQNMRQGLFGERGYGLDSLGTEASVKPITRQTIQDFYREIARPRNCVIAVYGAIDIEDLGARLETTLGPWTGDCVSAVSDAGPASITESKRVLESSEKQQGIVVMGFHGTTLHHADRYALDVLQEVCSDLGSRIFVRIRDRLGLAYYLGAHHVPGLIPGYFAFYAGTAPEHIERVQEEFKLEVQALCREGVSEEELKRAKAKILGQKQIARQDLGAFALSTALDELYGLSYNHWEEEERRYQGITGPEVQTAANRYLGTGNCVLAVIQPSAPAVG